MYTHQTQKGFVALMSIIIMSVVLLATTLSLAQFGIASRYFILDLENKSASERLAEACVHVARIAAYNDPLTDITNKVVPVGSESCTITNINPDSDESIIEVAAMRGNAETSYRVVVDNTDGDFVSWTEL